MREVPELLLLLRDLSEERLVQPQAALPGIIQPEYYELSTRSELQASSILSGRQR